MTTHRIGLELTPGLVKWIEGDPRQNSIYRSGYSWLEDDCFDGQGIPQTAALNRSLRTIVKQHGLERSKVIYNIPTSLARLEWLTLPKANEDHLLEIAHYKLGLNDRKTTLAVLPFTETPDSIHALVTCVDSQTISTHTKALTEAGLQPIGCEIDAVSLARQAMINWPIAGAYMQSLSMTLVDIGYRTTRFVAIQDGRISFVRVAKIGFDRILTAIQSATGLDVDGAYRVLIDPATYVSELGLLSNDEMLTAKPISLSDSLNSIVKELTRLSKYFKSISRDRNYQGLMDRALFCGEFAELQGFRQLLGQTMGVVTEQVLPFKKCNVIMECAGLMDFSRGLSRYGLALSLASAPYDTKGGSGFGDLKKSLAPAS